VYRRDNIAKARVGVTARVYEPRLDVTTVDVAVVSALAVDVAVVGVLAVSALAINLFVSVSLILLF
jgi:hypothetical protein